MILALLRAFLGEWLPLILAGLALVGAAVAYFRVPLIGKPLAIGLVALAAGLICYRWGYATRADQDHSADLRNRIAILEQDQARANRAAADADARAHDLETAAATDQDRISRYEQFLATQKPAGDVCSLDRNDLARGLRRKRP